jgi:hypothetical protein
VSLLSGIANMKNLSISAKDSISFAEIRRVFNAKNIGDKNNSFIDRSRRKGFSDNPVCTHRNLG